MTVGPSFPLPEGSETGPVPILGGWESGSGGVRKGQDRTTAVGHSLGMDLGSYLH